MCINKEELETILKEHEEKMKETAYMAVNSRLEQEKLHIKPSQETIDRLDKLEKIVEKILEQNDKMAPVLEGLHDAFVGGKFINRVFTGTAKFLVTVGALYGFIYGIKEWIKK